tara:strand:+ start:2067 stop:2501 length:435 start_codon:yes stop_codon:yes gene_type:complete
MSPMKKVKKHLVFDWRLAVVMLFINAVIVWLINFEQGMGAAAIQAALVQMAITTVTVGVFMPYIRMAANFKDVTQAFIWGGLLIPGLALVFSRSVHWYLKTPDLFWTTIYLVCSTVVASFIYVSLKQTAPYIPVSSARRFISKL